MTITIVQNRLAPRLVPLVVGVLAVTLTGCAGAAVDTDAPPADPETSAPADADGGDAGGDAGGDTGDGSGATLGTITTDSATYGVVEVVNCAPAQTTDLATELFDVVAFAQSAEGADVLFFVETVEQSGVETNYLTYQGPEGTRSSHDDNPTFAFDNGMLSGSSPLFDDDKTASITVQFEFEVPADLTDCD